jgi:hypothetical protein
MINNEISINPSSIARFLGAMALFLTLASLGMNLITYLTSHDYVYGLIPLFYLDEEMNIPTGYSVFLLQFAATLLLVISSLKRKYHDPFFIAWGVLALGFFYLSVDEAWSIHEKIDETGSFMANFHLRGFLRFSWFVPFLIIIPIIFLFFWKFLISLRFKTRKYFLLAAVIYLGGAIGFESIGGDIVDTIGRYNWWYYAEVSIEEGMEMFGVIVFIYALLDYLHDNFKEVRFSIIKSNDERLTEDSNLN